MAKKAAPSKKDRLSVEPYKGVRDFYPEEQAFLNYFIDTCRTFVERVGYVEYHASLLEPTELYRGKTSEEIVNEQMYVFKDRGEREVALRPEMTPTVVRMVAARRREMGFPLRLYSIPNVFRYERPQRGRLREHWQLNVDLFGSKSLAADVEIISMAYGLMRAFGAQESDFVIKVGSRNFLDSLVKNLGLSAEQGVKFRGLLDRRAKMPPGEFERDITDLGVAAEMLSSKKPPPDVLELLKQFEESGILNIVFAPEIVRGFDYYTGIVFEVFDTHKENSRALFGGGRYDNLFQHFIDEPIPAVGFAMGDVTIRDFLTVRGMLPPYAPPTHVYVAVTDAALVLKVQTFAGELRQQGVNVAIDFGEKKLADQIKTAWKHKIPYLIVLGEKELASGEFAVRNLATGAEKKISREQLHEFFLNA